MAAITIQSSRHQRLYTWYVSGLVVTESLGNGIGRVFVKLMFGCCFPNELRMPFGVLPFRFSDAFRPLLAGAKKVVGRTRPVDDEIRYSCSRASGTQRGMIVIMWHLADYVIYMYIYPVAHTHLYGLYQFVIGQCFIFLFNVISRQFQTIIITNYNVSALMCTCCSLY